MEKIPKNFGLVFLLLCISLLSFKFFPVSSFFGVFEKSGNSILEPQQKAVVTKVYDGDTFFIILEGEKKEQKIRLLGIDTPELQEGRKPSCKGKEVADFAKKMLEGKNIVVQYDTFAKKKDDFGRLLFYATLDKQDVGEILLEKGYAVVFRNEIFIKKGEYEKIFQHAQSEKKGIFDGSCL